MPKKPKTTKSPRKHSISTIHSENRSLRADVQALTNRTNGALIALKRSTEAKVEFASLLLQARFDLARLSGYIDRVREVEDTAINTDVPTVKGLTAQDLLDMPDGKFGKVMDTLSPTELQQAMENTGDGG